MSIPRVHHYYPQSLIWNWCGVDKRLTAFSKPYGDKVASNRCGPRAACQQRDLYSYIGLPEGPAQVLESAFFQRVDDDGAKVLTKMATNGMKSVTLKEREQLAVFILSLRARTPDTIMKAREMADKLFATASGWNEGVMSANGQTFTDFFKEKIGAVPDFALSQLPEVITRKEHVARLIAADWADFDFPDADTDLVLSDRASILQGSVMGTFMMAVPVGPRRAIVVASHRGMLHAMDAEPQSQVVETLNLGSATQAQRYLYATGEHHKPLAEGHLRPWTQAQNVASDGTMSRRP